jgi:hypothetical protein
MKKKAKKKVGDRIESILRILIPDHARKASDRAGWCGTVKDRPIWKPLKEITKSEGK